MKMKAVAAARRRAFSGIKDAAPSPKRTPKAVTTVSAARAPAKTLAGFLEEAVKVITANWVLSPISARNKVENAAIMVARSIPGL